MNDRPISIPNIPDWPSRKIGEVCQLISRGFAPAYVDYSRIRVIGQRCVQNDSFNASAARFHDIRISRVMRAENGDILLNSTGTGTIGRSCVFRPEGGDYIVDGHVTVLRPSLTVDSRWLNSLLRSPWGQRHLESYCYTGSTNQIELSRSELVKMEIPTPPIRDQRRIAEILDSVDDHINVTEKVISKLRLQKSGLLTQLLSEDTAQYPSASVGEVLLRIDAGWSPLCDEEPPSPGMWGVLKVSAVTSGDYLPGESKALLAGLAPRPEIEVKSGDVIMCRANGAEEFVGTVVIVLNTPTKLMLSDKTLRLIANAAIMDPGYLYHFMQSWQARKQINNLLSGSSGQKNISQKYIRSMKIPVPALNRQRQVVDAINAAEWRIHAENVSLRVLRTVRQGMIDDLLTGRVPV